MSKKLLSFFAAIGMIGAASSCTDEIKYNDGQDGDLVQVTFTISEDGVTASRAGGLVHYPTDGEWPQISDGSKAKRLIWAVYDKDGMLLPEIGANYVSKSPEDPGVAGYGQVAEKIDQFPHVITLTLVRGIEYSFAFWAQDPNCTAFNTKDLHAVSVDYKSNGNNLCNDELRDAFCKVETFTVSSAPSMQRTIILKRPFAQINVGIPQSEYEALRQSGVRIAKSKIHIENVATEFDVVSNSTHGDDATKRQAIDYEYNYIPAYYNWDVKNDSQIPTDEQLAEGRKDLKTQDLKIDLDHDGTIAPYGEQNNDVSNPRDETYNYMLMAYILPADRNDGTSTYSTTLDRVEFSLLPEKEGQGELTYSLENVPVQRNWRTNIFGHMFTSEVKLEIDLDPFYAGDYNYPDWERIYEGVTYDAMEQCIRISNGAGLAWLAKATNGEWPTEDAFVSDDSHNILSSATLQNNSKLFLKAVGLNEWPANGLFRFKDVTIKLDADIDLNTYANLFNHKDYYFTPIGFGGNDEVNHNLNWDTDKYFAGHFDGQNHTIYNLRTVRPADDDDSSMGLFSTIGREASIRNVRLKNVDIRGHYRTGGIVGSVYGPFPDETPVIIDNCYVDTGIIEDTSNDSGLNAKDVAGICGILYNNGTISNCFVRNIIVRGYRTISGIVGQTGGDYANNQQIINNSVYNVTLIADWFQYKDQGKSDYEIESMFIGESYWPTHVTDNKEGDNKIYAFWWKTIDGVKVTEIGRSELLNNPPLDIFPRMAFFTDKVHFTSSILGGPSAYKVYTDDDAPKYKGKADTNSGLVGLWVSEIEVDGQNGGDNGLDNATITASDVNGAKDCVVYIKNEATVKNITFHGATYAGQAICLAPASNKEIKLENVLAYDATRVLTDDGSVSGGKLTVNKSNFRGYVKLSKGYDEIKFTETTFDGSTKIYAETINRLESEGAVTLDGCTFIAPFEVKVGTGSQFNGCKAVVRGPEGDIVEGKSMEITQNGKITINDETGNLEFTAE